MLKITLKNKKDCGNEKISETKILLIRSIDPCLQKEEFTLDLDVLHRSVDQLVAARAAAFTVWLSWSKKSMLSAPQ